jgi:biopolymer transport protein ExbD
MRFKASKPSNVEIDMTPMIDMTFQLIAFFLIVSNFEKTQADERVKLPLDQLAKPPQMAREHELVVNVGFLRNKDGDLLDPEPWVFWTPQTSERVLNTLPLFQQEHRLRTSRDGEEIVGETYVVIRADGEVPTGTVQELIKVAQEAGFHKFVLSAQVEELTSEALQERFGW